MNMPALDPERIYAAIREGTRDAVMASFNKSYHHQSTGDRLVNEVKNGINDGLKEALRMNSEFRLPGDLIADAIQIGTKKAFQDIK